MALTDLSGISERRVERLVNPDLSEGLPAFLTAHPGTSSGFMIAQVSAVALLNEMKVLSHPACIDNLPTSAGKEDHVSMGMTSASKLRTIVDNAEYIVAIELLAAAQGLDYRAPLRPGEGAMRGFEIVRSLVPRLTEDRPLAPDIETIAAAVRNGAFDI
jgi:histidine ammonia-lyase